MALSSQSLITVYNGKCFYVRSLSARWWVACLPQPLAWPVSVLVPTSGPVAPSHGPPLSAPCCLLPDLSFFTHKHLELGGPVTPTSAAPLPPRSSLSCCSSACVLVIAGNKEPVLYLAHPPAIFLRECAHMRVCVCARAPTCACMCFGR